MSRVLDFKQIKYFNFIIPKLTVKSFRNAPMAIALATEPPPTQEPRPRVITTEPRVAI
jgi:hypothetical protein